MTLIELHQQVQELLAKHGDGEVSVCMEMTVDGERVQLSDNLGELVSCVSYKKLVQTGIKYILINEGFDNEY